MLYFDYLPSPDAFGFSKEFGGTTGPAAGHSSPACLAVSEDLRAAQRASSPGKCRSEASVDSCELVRSQG